MTAPVHELLAEGRAALRIGDAAGARTLLERARAHAPSGDVLEGLARAAYIELDATTDRELIAAAVTDGGGRSADLRIVDVTGRRPPFARLLRAFTAEHTANAQA